MANPEHLAMLRRGVNNGTAGEWIIPTCFLTEAKLWSADLSDANLHRAGRQGYWRNSSKSRRQEQLSRPTATLRLCGFPDDINEIPVLCASRTSLLELSGTKPTQMSL